MICENFSQPFTILAVEKERRFLERFLRKFLTNLRNILIFKNVFHFLQLRKGSQNFSQLRKRIKKASQKPNFQKYVPFLPLRRRHNEKFLRNLRQLVYFSNIIISKSVWHTKK